MFFDTDIESELIFHFDRHIPDLVISLINPDPDENAIASVQFGVRNTANPDCNLVCQNPLISDSISFPAYRENFNITLNFEKTFKMCHEEIEDADSLNGRATMLYFFRSDGSGLYVSPSTSTLDSGTASIDAAYDSFNMSVSPLPSYNSFTNKYFNPEDIFRMSVKNFGNLDDNNDYDFLWVYADIVGESVDDQER